MTTMAGISLAFGNLMSLLLDVNKKAHTTHWCVFLSNMTICSLRTERKLELIIPVIFLVVTVIFLEVVVLSSCLSFHCSYNLEFECESTTSRLANSFIFGILFCERQPLLTIILVLMFMKIEFAQGWRGCSCYALLGLQGRRVQEQCRLHWNLIIMQCVAGNRVGWGTTCLASSSVRVHKFWHWIWSWIG